MIRPATRCIGLLAATIGLLVASPSIAQHTTASVQPTSWRSPPNASRGGFLRGRLSLSVAGQLLRSTDVEEQVRGAQRLAAQNDYEAVQVLLQALAERPRTTIDPRLCLESIRTFAPFASRSPVRSLLLSWMVSCTGTG